MASLTDARSAKGSIEVAPAVAAADRIRRSATELLARFDTARHEADIKAGDPIELVMTANRDAISWTAEVALDLAASARPLSPDAERKLIDRVASLAGLAIKGEAKRMSRSTTARTLGVAGCCIALALALGAAGGYWLGARENVVAMQVRPGEILGHCVPSTVQAASDGNGRVCAAWIRLDQASFAGAPGR